MGHDNSAASPMLESFQLEEDQRSKGRGSKSIRATPWGLFCQLSTHFVALGATLGVILLSLRQCYFADVDGPFESTKSLFSTNNKLHAMQFAAKLHDITMIGSLSNIAFHLWTSHLLSTSGVPLGLLTAPFKLGKPQYLISSELREGFRKSILLAILLFLASILVFLLAPVSAIMLVPTLDWWLIPAPYSGGR